MSFILLRLKVAGSIFFRQRIFSSLAAFFFRSSARFFSFKIIRFDRFSAADLKTQRCLTRNEADRKLLDRARGDWFYSRVVLDCPKVHRQGYFDRDSYAISLVSVSDVAISVKKDRYRVLKAVGAEKKFLEAFLGIFIWGDSWQHFIQDALPYLNYAGDFLRSHETLPILTWKPKFDSFEFILRKELGIRNPVRFISDGEENVGVKQLYFIRQFPGPRVQSSPLVLTKQLHQRIMAQGQDRPADKCIWISRKDNPTRAIINEDRVCAILKDYARENNLIFVNFKAEEFSPEERFELFRQAKVVVAGHGGANFHLLWCRSGTIFIEIVFTAHMNSLFFLAESCGLRYMMLPVPDVGHFSKSVQVDPQAIRECLAQF